MDSRDWIVLGVAGVGAYVLYRWWQGSTAQPAADGNPAGAGSMTAGAAQQTVFGASSIRNIIAGGGTVSFGGIPARGQTFRTSAQQLLGLNLAPKPVALTPVVTSGPSSGLGPTQGSLPPPQRLNPTVNPSPLSTYRGIN